MSSVGGGGGGGGDKASPGLTIDRAAFLLLRVKKAFKKKKQQRKEKSAPPASECTACNKQESKGPSSRGPGGGGGGGGRPAPLLRSRTLPAIVAPGLNILQAQIDARYSQSGSGVAVIPPYSSNGPNLGKRDSSVSYCSKLLAPRISFTDDTIGERRVSDTGTNYRDNSGGKESGRASGRLSTSSIGTSQPLTILARLLNQRPSFTPSDDIPRRLSWERRECGSTSSCLPRSSSIDSVAEWNLVGGGGLGSVAPAADVQGFLGAYGIQHAENQAQQQQQQQQQQPTQKRSPSPLLGSRADRLSLVSPSIGRRVKGHRAVLG